MQVIIHARHMVLEGYDTFYGYNSTLDLRGLGTLPDTAFIRFPPMSSYWGQYCYCFSQGSPTFWTSRKGGCIGYLIT
jgi:hypothetical protein